MFDNAFYLTLLFLLISTLIGTFISGRKKDKCLKDFAHFPVTLKEKLLKNTWGILHVEKTGIELLYKQEYIDDDHVEKSYILYKNEFPNILLLFRFLADLESKEAKKRQLDIKRTYNPSFFRRSKRMLHNIFNTISDRIKEAFGLILGQIKKAGAPSQIINGREQYINRIESDVTGGLQNTYDPLLEKLIGKKVVFEINNNGIIEELVGILKEYTADFLEFLDVSYTENIELKSDGTTKQKIGTQIIIAHENNKLVLHNNSNCTITLTKILQGDNEIPFDIKISKKESCSLPQEKLSPSSQEFTLFFDAIRTADIIVPRGHGIVRHRGE